MPKRVFWLVKDYPANPAARHSKDAASVSPSCPSPIGWERVVADRVRELIEGRDEGGRSNHFHSPIIFTSTRWRRLPSGLSFGRSAVCPKPQRVARPTRVEIIRAASRSATRCELGPLAFRLPPPAWFAKGMILIFFWSAWRRGFSVGAQSHTKTLDAYGYCI